MQSVFDRSDITIVGKLFLASIASAILGRKSRVSVKGTPEQISAIEEAIRATVAFRDELKNPDATVQSMVDKLSAKNAAAKRFLAATGLPFPL